MIPQPILSICLLNESKSFWVWKLFIDSSLSIVPPVYANPLPAIIGTIISNEDKSNPYDDQSIVSILEKEDYIVARRTVSKYRSLMGIAKSKLRREITDE